MSCQLDPKSRTVTVSLAMRLGSLALAFGLALCAAQWLPDNDIADPMATTYGGEVCRWYDVRRLSWMGVRALGGNPVGDENDHRRWPRLGLLTPMPSSRIAPSVCDGYGAHKVRVPCDDCPGDQLFPRRWHVLLCAARPVAPTRAPLGAGAPTVNVLLIGSDHNNHGLFAQVERVLNQLLLSETLGLVPHVFLGRKVQMPPNTCAVGENQYFDHPHGDNVWEYFFEPVSAHRLGNASLGGRAVRLLVANADDARRHDILTHRDAVTSYFEFQRYDEMLHEIRQRVRRLGAKLVARWVRVLPHIRRKAVALLRGWRAKSTSLLGVHLRGARRSPRPSSRRQVSGPASTHPVSPCARPARHRQGDASQDPDEPLLHIC